MPEAERERRRNDEASQNRAIATGMVLSLRCEIFQVLTAVSMPISHITQTDGLLSSSTEGECDVFLLCATNCPWELDRCECHVPRATSPQRSNLDTLYSAFVRRFQKRIYIPLPDHGARKEMVKILIGMGFVSNTELNPLASLVATR